MGAGTSNGTGSNCSRIRSQVPEISQGGRDRSADDLHQDLDPGAAAAGSSAGDQEHRQPDPSADDLHQDPDLGAVAAGSSAGDQPGRPGSIS